MLSANDDALGWLLVAKQLARQAGDTINALRHPAQSLSSGLRIDSKSGSSDLVTSADIASQKLIFDGIRSAYASHRLIGEEDEEDYGELDDRPTWIVDAIDGTTNFVHGLSDVAVSIAFCKDSKVQVGVVYNPFSKEMFSSVRGRGAFLNDKPISVSNCSTLQNAIIISEWGYDRTPDGARKMLAVNERLIVANTRGVRQIGSGSLDMCYVAMGRVDGVYCGVAQDAWKIWDYAAASLVCEEAGATLTTIDNSQFFITSSSMVCATPSIHANLISAIQSS